MILALSSIAHFLVDALCAAVLLEARAKGTDIALAVIIYNTLAFSTQCLVGLLTDRIGNAKRLGSAAMLLIVAGSIIPLPFMIRVILTGIGNSFFHVACGSMTIMRYKGRGKELGIFVAPGALGLTLGTVFPGLKLWLALLLTALSAVLFLNRDDGIDYDAAPANRSEEKISVFETVLLILAVTVRAIGGSAAVFSWNKGAAAAFILGFFVALGKTMGGFVLEKLGTVKTAAFSIVPAAICIAFFSSYAVPSIIGQFLLNLTMPVTLFLLVKRLPDSPGLAFGLAASALWPGTIIGNLFTLTGPALWLCVMISFVFGLWAILFCERRVSK